MARTPSRSGSISKRTPSPPWETSIGYVCVEVAVWWKTWTDRENFSKFLVKDGQIKWFPARSTKVSDVEAAL